MQIGHDGDCSVGHDGSGVLPDVEHGAFDVNMAVYQTRAEVLALQIDDPFGFRIAAHAGDASFGHGHRALLDLASERIDDLRVHEQQIRDSIASGYSDQPGQVHVTPVLCKYREVACSVHLRRCRTRR